MLRRIIITTFLLIVWLASSWAVLVPGFFRVHDYVHAVRIAEFQRALMDGHFPVRWSENLGYGYGMPLFEFYAPLPYLVGAILFSLGLPILIVLKVLFAGCSAVTLWGSYKLGKEVFGRTGGLLTAALLTLAPYRAVNLFIRGALSEVWGIMALPWVIWAIIRVAKGDKKAGVSVAGWLAVLFLSHNLVSLLSVPLLLSIGLAAVAFYAVTYQPKLKIWWDRVLVLFVSGLTGGLMAVFYVVPALVEKGYTRVSTITQGYFDYHLHFLYIRQFITPNWGYGGSSWGPEDGISFFLGIGQLVALAITGLLVLWRLAQWWRGHAAKNSSVRVWRQLRWWLVAALVLAGSLAMTLLKAQPVWDAIPFLSFVQFPWRWLSVSVVAIALMGGSLALLIETKWKRWAMVFVLVWLSVGNAWYFRPEMWLDDPQAFYYTDEPQTQRVMSDVLQDYIPGAVPVPTQPPAAKVWDSQTFEPLAEDQLLVDRVQEKLVVSSAEQPHQLTFAIADFPGWQAEVNGIKVPTGQTPQGLLTVDVPKGEHKVGVRFAASPVRAVADTISAVAWLGWSWAAVAVLSKKRAEA